MKKVGILTFHFADSFGALLQAFALRKVINKLQGCNAEVINYIPEQWKMSPYVNTIEGRAAFTEKRKKFCAFMRRHLGIDKEVCTVVEGNAYDYYCVGSDQVWNSLITHCDGYYLPHVSQDAKKIAYAASIGNPLEDERLDKDVLKKYLPSFKNISVREVEYCEFVEEITGRECKWVLDPTLLLDANEYEEIVANKENAEPFVFLFWLNKDEQLKGVEIANIIARKYNLKIVHSLYDSKKYTFYNDGGCMTYEGVEDFLWYMKNAYFIVTDSYHGTIFALQYKKPFYTYIYKERRKRIDTISKALGFEERVIERNLLYSDINEQIDFDAIWENIYRLREKSFDYLNDSLECEVC